jgi:putative transposase
MEPSYPTDMSDEQWELLLPLLPPAKAGGRPRSVDLRAVVNAIF